jgi:Cu(I)/Ag(I) efflux system membrane fusion protein
MSKTIPIVVAVLATSLLAGSARAGSCCLAEKAAPDPAKNAAAKSMPAPLPAVLESYGKVHNALASDSTDGVAGAAQAMAKLLAGDPNKTLPEVVAPAEALGKATTLADARTAFKTLTNTLIRYLSKQKFQTGQYHVAYCDMAKAHWLQTDKAIKNPYFGKEMLACGKIIGNL